MHGRPSKFVVALARWALMTGLAGVVMSTLALFDQLRSPFNDDSRRTLLFVAAILLSVSFVLAPLVRRAFARPADFTWRGRHLRKTLLDEMRERGDFDADSQEHDSSEIAQRDSKALIVVRLLLAAYGVFAVVLAWVLWQLR